MKTESITLILGKSGLKNIFSNSLRSSPVPANILLASSNSDVAGERFYFLLAQVIFVLDLVHLQDKPANVPLCLD